jgi:hypothetical protein
MLTSAFAADAGRPTNWTLIPTNSANAKRIEFLLDMGSSSWFPNRLSLYFITLSNNRAAFHLQSIQQLADSVAPDARPKRKCLPE